MYDEVKIDEKIMWQNCLFFLWHSFYYFFWFWKSTIIKFLQISVCHNLWYVIWCDMIITYHPVGRFSHHSWAWTICVGIISWQFTDYIAALVRMSCYCSQLWLFLLNSSRNTHYYTSSMTVFFFVLCFYLLEGFQKGDNDIVPHKTILSIADDITSVCKTGRERGCWHGPCLEQHNIKCFQSLKWSS